MSLPVAMEAACVLFFGLLFFSPVYEGVSEQHVSMAANIQGDDLLKFWNMRVAHEEPRLLWLRRTWLLFFYEMLFLQCAVVCLCVLKFFNDGGEQQTAH